jgi:hypothetical protein
MVSPDVVEVPTRQHRARAKRREVLRHEQHSTWARGATDGPTAKSALDRHGRFSRLLVWVTIGAMGLAGGSALAVRLNRPSPELPGWSVQAPGVLELEGKPTVDLDVVDGRTTVRVTTDDRVLTYRVETGAGIRPRAFWRGDRLMIDAGESSVWAIDVGSRRLVKAPSADGWSASK